MTTAGLCTSSMCSAYSHSPSAYYVQLTLPTPPAADCTYTLTVPRPAFEMKKVQPPSRFSEVNSEQEREYTWRAQVTDQLHMVLEEHVTHIGQAERYAHLLALCDSASYEYGFAIPSTHQLRVEVLWKDSKIQAMSIVKIWIMWVFWFVTTVYTAFFVIQKIRPEQFDGEDIIQEEIEMSNIVVDTLNNRRKEYIERESKQSSIQESDMDSSPQRTSNVEKYHSRVPTEGLSNLPTHRNMMNH